MQSKGMYTGHLAMLGANLLWGVMSPLSKAVLQSGLVGPLSLTTLRMVGAAAATRLPQMLPRPIAQPAVSRMKPSREPRFSRDES